MLRCLCGSPSIPLSFNLAAVLYRQKHRSRYRLCHSEDHKERWTPRRALLSLFRRFAHSDKKIDPISLHNLVAPKFSELNMDLSLLKRNNNVNFSGGQKKKNELVQMFLMNNNVLLLDEVDSGCDVDSLKIIAREINKIKKDKIIILISHQQQLLKQIEPTKYITIANHKIVDSGSGTKLFAALDKGFSKYIKAPVKKQEMDSLKNVF